MRDGAVLETIRRSLEQMPSSEKKVARFLLEKPADAVLMNVSELAAASGVSDATVVRMCKRTKFSGYYQMIIHISNELGRSVLNRQKQRRPDSVRGILEIIAANAMDMAESLDVPLMLSCVGMIKSARTVHAVASGNTSPIAMDICYRLSRCGVRATYFSTPEYYVNNILQADSNDLVLAISRTGSTGHVVTAVELAREKGLRCLAVTSDNNSRLARLADMVLPAAPGVDYLQGDHSPTSHTAEMIMNDLIIFFIQNSEQFSGRASDAGPALLKGGQIG
ncbi:MAG: MurR/RpiR family transcriptional regulator [Synergistaceae bacterium]|jgi:DNA-binding MurR/RpiR family transcriptional regulator|nr:MurR/RpiR family transcriptional regulator [Synergistaceae bacterium]